jgi:hypothetical protein
MRRMRWGMLLGGLLVLLLGGLLLPVVNGLRVGSGHPLAAASTQPQVEASVPPPTASTGPEPAPNSSTPTTVSPVKPTSQPAVASPSLQILSPKAGDQVGSPFTVRYLISGVDAGTVAGLSLRLTIGSPAFYATSLQISGLQGSATVPDDKMISGVRDLVFSLARADGAPMAGSPPAVVVTGVTISGRR